ncbi:MAG TPA: bifunctional 5,10-methylenetetrahydrofolate dehydrogenase/5,10-methenyltetrahydrofolate cyclohydrolase [Deltaproteobacteria bacterium]|nr:bifunctional 5,10-methylenetetrahydrofolate dehydrogenase/5,10-methenyltetrahydrofolate cyclohydrolase [Deltaproteobacteria bacterium]
MSARILDGRALARRLNQALKIRAAELPRPPGLGVVLVGEDPASRVYVRRKGIVAERLGFLHRQHDLPADSSLERIQGVVAELNDDPAIDGILVQLPLPGGLDGRLVTEWIEPDKDVDGLTTISAGLLAQGRPHLIPCTPLGILRLLEEAEVSLEGLDAVVIGRSNLVGRPVAHLLEQANATVTQCHSRTRDLAGIVGRSDVVVAALGHPGAVEGEWIRPGAVVIDVGVNRLEDGTLAGDVGFEVAAQRASAITPVPGGVGPMTIAMLMENTLRASAQRQGRPVD